MAKISANYEVVYIIDPAQGEEAIAATVAKFQTLAEQNATNVVVDEWGKRRLAYAIDYKTEGYYADKSESFRSSYRPESTDADRGRSDKSYQYR